MRKLKKFKLWIQLLLWLKLEKAVDELEQFMNTQGLECKPEAVSNLKGDMARAMFIDRF